MRSYYMASYSPQSSYLDSRTSALRYPLPPKSFGDDVERYEAQVEVTYLYSRKLFYNFRTEFRAYSLILGW